MLNEAGNLIESAKKALEYKTAEGLSAAFSEKYIESQNRQANKNWLRSSFAFVLCIIGLGLWTIFKDSLSLTELLNRLIAMPVLVAGAWFCAGQFVKNRNIAEDYGYKSVLAKSLVSD